jgi:hypothetical protein
VTKRLNSVFPESCGSRAYLCITAQKNPENETLWSQVLGEVVIGPLIGTELDIIPSTITRLSDWTDSPPDTKVLARPENSRRNYNRDPYERYYASNRVSMV